MVHIGFLFFVLKIKKNVKKFHSLPQKGDNSSFHSARRPEIAHKHGFFLVAGHMLGPALQVRARVTCACWDCVFKIPCLHSPRRSTSGSVFSCTGGTRRDTAVVRLLGAKCKTKHLSLKKTKANHATLEESLLLFFSALSTFTAGVTEGEPRRFSRIARSFVLMAYISE